MKPLFEPDCSLVGWMDPAGYIFNTDLEWVAFVSNGHAWSSKSVNWLGSVEQTTCRDTKGRPVAWSPGLFPSGTARPATPARAAIFARPAQPAWPATPATPARAAMPAGGWSDLAFAAWLAQ